MESFIIKTGKPDDKIEKSHFFVLNKGLNAGKPLSCPCPNCFKIEAENAELKESLYWLTYSLWRSRVFLPLLVGSVIPFIRIGDYKKLVEEKLKIVNQDPKAFSKTIYQLRFIEEKEKQFRENLRLIGELKRTLIQKCLQ